MCALLGGLLEAFKGLSLPCTLRGGYLEEITAQLPLGVVFGSVASLKAELAKTATTLPTDQQDKYVVPCILAEQALKRHVSLALSPWFWNGD
eukprot:5782653-Amphidinium_carterae.1